MEAHFELSDDDFEEQFKNCSLNPTLFSHEAHIRLAWIHLTRYSIGTTIQNLCSQIALFDRIHDDGTKFHKTLTIASIYIVALCIDKSTSKTFRAFIQEFPHLNTNFKEILLTYYSADTLYSIEAKKEYVEPDLIGFNKFQ